MRCRSVKNWFPPIAIFIIALLPVACGEDSNPADESGGMQQVEIVVLKNNTSIRVAGATIIIDDDDNLSCITSEVNGDSGGNCFFVLEKKSHSITIAKPGYHILTTTFLVTSSTTIKYFSIFNY